MACDLISRREILFSLRHRKLEATGDGARRKAATGYQDFSRPMAAEAMRRCE